MSFKIDLHTHSFFSGDGVSSPEENIASAKAKGLHGFALTDHIGFDLRYWDTDEHHFGSIYDSRVVIGVKATF